MLYHIIFHADQVSQGNADTSVHVEFELAKKKISSFQRSFQRSYLETIGKKCLISPWGQPWERVFQDCPHGEVVFSTSMCIYNVKTYNNLLRY